MTLRFSFRRYALLGLVAATAAGCEPKLEDAPAPTKGSADFSRYYAIGNSLTAGYEDNGLYLEGQQNSYPSMLAQQFAQVGGGAFVQPLFASNQANGSGYLRLAGFKDDGSPDLVTVTTSLAETGDTIDGGPRLAPYAGALNNLGVPGIGVRDLTTTNYGQANVYYNRMPGSDRSYLQFVSEKARDATFFTCWLGNNDVLGFATSGGALANVDNNYKITALPTFTTKLGSMVDTLTAHGAKGVVGNIPNVTDIPFFNTVGPPLKAGLRKKGVTGMVATTGSFVLFGTTGPARKSFSVDDIKDATGGQQLFTLTASSYTSLIGDTTGKYWRDFYEQLASALPAGQTLSSFLTANAIDTTHAFGVTTENPWPSTLLLDNDEQAQVRQATSDFNAALKTKAEAKGLAFFDANAFFTQIAAQGLVVSGVNNSASYLAGNLFSLDGVHPTPRGYAIVANELIRTINAKYGSTLAPVDPNQYRGVRLP